MQHMEPDHSANINVFMARYPAARVVASAKAFAMMRQFYGQDYAQRRVVVGEGDILPLGKHTLSFVAAPMVHWPEVIVTYDAVDKILYSADAFGKFGALDADEPWDDEARRYYIGIVGKYGAQVQALLKKAAALDIAAICPLHGPVLRENLAHYLHLYQCWSGYVPEASGTVIACASIYGHTWGAAQELTAQLRAAGRTVALYDLARCDLPQAVADAFRYDQLVLCSSTYNADVFPCMRAFIEHLAERGYRNRTVALVENGTWAPMAAKVMQRMLESLKVALIIQRHNACMPNVAWCEVTDMLFKNNRKIAAKYFDAPLGILKPGAAADVIVMDYKCFTPFSDANIDGHMIFGMTGRQCETTMCNGKLLMKDRQLIGIDEEAMNARTMEASKKLWSRLNG